MPACPICYGSDFICADDGSKTRCTSCGADARARMMAAVLLRTDVGLPLGPVVHFAPQPALERLMRRRFGGHYRPTGMADMIGGFAAESIYGFVHSHVLQQVSEDPAGVIERLNAALMPGGFQMFQMPLRSDGREIANLVLPKFQKWNRKRLLSPLGDAEAYEYALPGSALSRNNASTVYVFVKPKRR